MEDRNRKIIAAEATLIQKQQIEMNALKKKLETNLNERLKLREQEHNKLLQRYQNVKKEIGNQQQTERFKFDKNYMNVQQPQSNSSPMKTSVIQKSKMAGSSGKKSSIGISPASKPSNA